MHGHDAETGAADLPADIAAWQRWGDESAARRLMAALYPLVVSIIRGRLPRRTAEEDLAQEIFVRFFERIGTYDGRAPLKHWLSRLAVNVCIDALRAERRRPELRWADLSEAEAEALSATVADAGSDAPTAAAANDLVTRLLETLDPKDRVILQMIDLEGHTVPEVSARTGWSQALIKVRAFRARKKLRKTIATLDEQK